MKRVTVVLANGQQLRIDAPDDAVAAEWLKAVFTAILLETPAYPAGGPDTEITVRIRA